jgi:hypothetical protein
MSRAKDDWIEATGGLSAHPLEQRVRLRIRMLADKLKSSGLNEDEHIEYLRLVNSLPDDDKE